jgi:hypothetical protein
MSLHTIAAALNVVMFEGTSLNAASSVHTIGSLLPHNANLRGNAPLCMASRRALRNCGGAFVPENIVGDPGNNEKSYGDYDDNKSGEDRIKRRLMNRFWQSSADKDYNELKNSFLGTVVKLSYPTD